MRQFIPFLLMLHYFGVSAQQQVIQNINEVVLQHEAEAHLSFLASDEMRGRNTGSPELDIAANYIRTQFKVYNLPPVPGAQNYFQDVELVRHSAPAEAHATLGKAQFTLKTNLLVLGGGPVQWSGDLVYVGYGAPDDLARQDLKGKMVLALAGSKDADNINKVYMASREKHGAVQKMGATGLIEVLAFPQVPWPALVNFFSQEQWGITAGEKSIPFIWLKPANVRSLSFREGEKIKGKLMVHAAEPQPVKGKNVAALVKGTDDKLKDGYVVITAHYDHIGVQPAQDGQDSIFNGARDNATGTVALLQAAKYLGRFPPKRSVILLAVTGEEKGLLGSSWYVKHPLVPLQQHVLNINCDGVGYNDISRITSISLGRTNVDDLLLTAAKAYGLTVGGDPDPKEGFYERSDQASFAKEGIPAIKLQPGLAQMDEAIWNYYHRPADEVASMDMEYITKFYRTFVYAVHLLANDSRNPAWMPGDKFEEAGKKLYRK